MWIKNNQEPDAGQAPNPSMFIHIMQFATCNRYYLIHQSAHAEVFHYNQHTLPSIL